MRLSAPLATLLLMAVVALDAQQASGLKIIVLAGEGARNIIQPNTSVRTLVEIRDRNDRPVSGATVTFSIAGGGAGAAFAGGAQTLTVTTSATGQAAASGLTPLSSGALQIQVQAVYQGQVATATISQTNFATAAAAAQVAGAAGGAAGGGGGISATTIFVVGAAVGGGALVAMQTAAKSDEEPSEIFRGSLSGQLVLLSLTTDPEGQVTSCTRIHSVSGPLQIELLQGNATGSAASKQITLTETSLTGGCIPATAPITLTILPENAPVTGGPSALTFTTVAQLQNVAYTLAFNGSQSDNSITGTFSIEVVSSAPTGPDQPSLTVSTSFPIRLTGSRP